ncbi:hypothetical protein PM082_016617 [Marasmius tenuissimus]|nr:hypothetical protein PM082_016617 [Marasmius tenuissimus]
MEIQPQGTNDHAKCESVANGNTLGTPARTSEPQHIALLPTELLREIFLNAISGEPDLNTFGVYQSWFSMSLRISAVCRLWRDVALDTKQLWAFFAVYLDKRAKDPVELFLERSGDTPLSLVMTSTDVDGQGDVELLNLLIKHSFRWISIDYHDIFDSDLRAYLIRNLDDEGLPLLESVVCDSDVDPDRVIIENQLESSRHLDTIIVRYVFYSRIEISSLPLSHPEFKNLIIQHNRDGCLQNFLEILVVCGRNIINLTYEYSTNTLSPNSVPRSIHTPLTPENKPGPVTCSARKFNFSLWDSEGTYPLLTDTLDCLTLPSLTDLRIWGDCENDKQFRGSWPKSSLDSFFARSRCVLTSLKVSGMPVSGEDILSLLKHTPHLHTFFFTELFANDYYIPHQSVPQVLVKSITKSFVEAFRLVDPLLPVTSASDKDPKPGQDVRDVLLPRLKRLKFRVQQHFDADVEFVEMVRSRRSIDYKHGIQRLCSVSLNVLNKVLEGSVYEPLKELDKEGLMVVVHGDGMVVV